MKKAIVVLTMARSRSSLVSHLLYRHGVWSASCKPPDEYNRVPYHENRIFKRLINERRPKIFDTLEPTYIDGFTEILKERLEELGYKEPFLIKVDAFCWPLFLDFDPVFIKLYRDPEGILDSIKRTPFMKKQGYSDERWREIIKAHHDEMDKLDGFKIDTDRMLTDYSEFKTVIDHIGLEFKPHILDETINCNGYQYL